MEEKRKKDPGALGGKHQKTGRGMSSSGFYCMECYLPGLNDYPERLSLYRGYASNYLDYSDQNVVFTVMNFSSVMPSMAYLTPSRP